MPMERSHTMPPWRSHRRWGLRLVAATLVAMLGYLGHRGSEGAAQVPELPVVFIWDDMREVSQKVKAAFPGAMRGPDVFSRALQAMKPYGVKKKNAIYGQSIGFDEINSDRGHVSTLFTKYYGHVFQLGGLGGAPYVGKTGFGAFSHHVPDDGHVVLLFGPHIGFNFDGKPGKFLRQGQKKESTACGAVIAAYNQITSGRSMMADPQDSQQTWLRHKLRRYCDDISKSKAPMVELVKRVYKIVEEELMGIVNTDFGTGNLVLIGGIQINMPYPMNGYFLPLHFSIRGTGRKVKNLMDAFN